MRSTRLGDLWAALLDVLYPPRCVVCESPGAWFCPRCIRRSPRVVSPFCVRCGGPPGRSRHGLCPECRTTRSRISRTRSAFYFEGPLRTAIHRLKYDGVTALAQPLAALMAECWLTHSMSGDIIVAVALHRDRRRQRGFNQAALLAEALSELVNVPLDAHTLVRQRATASQIGLDVEERRRNVRDAFRCTTERLAGRRVVLIDDVRTSGATLEACAAALIEGGATSVQALTLARAR